MATAAFCQDIPEIGSSVSTTVDLGYVSKYVWRGVPLNSEPATQPSVTVSHKSGVSFNFWGSMDTTGITGHAGDFTEVDYTLNYAWKLMGKEMNAGVVNYTYPNTSAAQTSEVYASTCLGGKFSPSVSLNYDFDQAKGYYASVGAGYGCPLPWSKKAPSATISGKIGFGSSNFNEITYGANKTGFTDALISAAVPYAAGRVTVTPSLSYSRTLDSRLRDAMSASNVKRDNLFLGLTVSTPL